MVGVSLLLPLLVTSTLYCALASTKLPLRFACCKLRCFLEARVVMARIKQTTAPRDGAPWKECKIRPSKQPAPHDGAHVEGM
jgi:hypothetical protein